MTQLIAWCGEHWQDILAVIGGTVGVATVIVKLTPTQKDDAVLAALSLVNPDGSFVGKAK